MSRDRRRDPRTDQLYSLRNLLRVRSDKFQMPVLVLGTEEDVLIAGSQEDRQAERTLLRASNAAAREPGAADHVRHRFSVFEQTLVLVSLGSPSGAGGPRPGFLEGVLLSEVAQRVRRIFSAAA